MSDNEIKILDIGCGNRKVPGAIGIDFNNTLDADIVHNLNKFPYPFKDDEFDEVFIGGTLCLLDNAILVMEEVHRVCKKHAKIKIVQPYFRSVWNFADPWIKNFGTVHSFAFYDPDDPICTRYMYTSARFKTVSITFDEYLDNPSIIRKIVIKFATRFPRKYELYLSHFFPLNNIIYQLIKL
jgi:SAM-dependent methyltransferase